MPQAAEGFQFVNRSFTAAWMADKAEATALLPLRHRDPAQRRQAAMRAAERSIHPAVLASLVATTPAQEESRRLLAEGGACCMVTGQQAGLFGGPLYSVYKTAAAIANARALTAETGVPCVPIFWLQNEDHDFEEIATCAVPVDTAMQRISVSAAPEEAGRSIAARRFDDGIVAAVDALADCLTGPHAAAVIEQVRAAYRPGRSPCAAFRDLIEALFADHGLLVVDPMAIPEAAEAVHRRALDEARTISARLQAQVDAIEAAGFTAQVHVRTGAPLSFYHPEGLTGARQRIEPEPGHCAHCGAEHDESVHESVGMHTTSALLRPILQDTWLPTAGYVGGPGEIAYFAQLPPLYAHFDLPMPMIIPRARFQVIDAKATRLLEQLGLAPQDLTSNRDAMLARVGRTDTGMAPEALEAALLAPMRAALDAFTPHAAFDKGLAKATAKTRASLTAVAERLIDRYRRTLAREDTVTIDRLDRLLTLLLPDGAPQERVHCWPWYGAQFGVRGFVDLILAATIPFKGTVQTVRP